MNTEKVILKLKKIVEKILQKQGWGTRLLHFPRMGKQALPLPPALSHLKKYLIPGEFGPTAFFTRYQRFGPSPEDSAGIILSENPDAVFGAKFTQNKGDGRQSKQRPDAFGDAQRAKPCPQFAGKSLCHCVMRRPHQCGANTQTS